MPAGTRSALRQDDTLVAYYTFDKRQESAAQLVNHATVTAGRLCGFLGDRKFSATRPMWAAGRWANKKTALDFTAGLDQRVYVDYDPASTAAASSA